MINQYVLKKTYVLWIINFSLMKNPFYCQIDIHQSPKFVHDIVTGIIFSSDLLSQKVVVHITRNSYTVRGPILSNNVFSNWQRADLSLHVHVTTKGSIGLILIDASYNSTEFTNIFTYNTIELCRALS